MLLGILLTRSLKLPPWVTPAMSFNNTTSLPLLLIQSLDSTGILKNLLMSDTDTTSDALNRAKSYFLVCAIVSNSMTFALGPRLLDHEEAPNPVDLESQIQRPHGTRQGESQEPQGESEATESTSLLPDSVTHRGAEAGDRVYRRGRRVWDRLNPKTQSFLDLLYDFLNAPLLGALVGALIGLAPPLHQAFFNEPQQGGIFKAWLTSCIKSVGSIFAALQVGTTHTEIIHE